MKENPHLSGCVSLMYVNGRHQVFSIPKHQQMDTASDFRGKSVRDYKHHLQIFLWVSFGLDKYVKDYGDSHVMPKWHCLVHVWSQYIQCNYEYNVAFKTLAKIETILELVE